MGGADLNDSVTNAHSLTQQHGVTSGGASSPNPVEGKRRVGESKRQAQQQRAGQATMPGTGQGQYDKEFEEEFEKLYKRDIDKFIDGSNFEVESLSGFSELSGGAAAGDPSRTKQLEQEYVRKLEQQKAKHQQLREKGRSRQAKGHTEGHARKH